MPLLFSSLMELQKVRIFVQSPIIFCFIFLIGSFGSLSDKKFAVDQVQYMYILSCECAPEWFLLSVLSDWFVWFNESGRELYVLWGQFRDSHERVV